MEVCGDNSCPSPCNTLGFLQKNNSLDDKGRLAGHKNLLSCNNGERDTRFRLTETDFSNLFARGKKELWLPSAAHSAASAPDSHHRHLHGFTLKRWLLYWLFLIRLKALTDKKDKYICVF